jgi:DNA-binding NarL/FixJ family response regulator
MIEIVIVEDNTFVQRRLKTLLGKGKGFKIVGAFSDLKSAVAATLKRSPHLVMLDLKLPDVRGTEGVAAMLRKFSGARLAVYTAYENETDILKCMIAGAHGYILKDTPDDRLRGELRVIAQGGSTLTPSVAEKLLKYLTGPKSGDSLLSPRETEVLNFISLGLNYEDIAAELNISSHTVRRHIEKIYKKLNVSSRSQAIAHAVRSGILKLD